MISDVYMIFITALAVFGLYCIAEDVLMYMGSRNSAKIIALVVYDETKDVCGTVQFLHNTVFNCQIVVVAEKDGFCPLADTVSAGDLHQYITNDLFTKN